MANWSVHNLTFAPLDTAINSSTQLTGKYWASRVSVGAQIFERRRIQLPGLNKIRVKKYGSRGTNISGEVVYINTSHANVYLALEADRSTLINQEFTVTPPQGTQYLNCELVSFEEGECYLTAGGKYLLKGMLQLFSLD